MFLSQALAHVESWRGKEQITAGKLLVELWKREEKDMGVARDSVGKIRGKCLVQIEITSWIVRAYGFYIKSYKALSMMLFVYFIGTEIYLRIILRRKLGFERPQSSGTRTIKFTSEKTSFAQSETRTIKFHW